MFDYELRASNLPNVLSITKEGGIAVYSRKLQIPDVVKKMYPESLENSLYKREAEASYESVMTRSSTSEDLTEFLELLQQLSTPSASFQGESSRGPWRFPWPVVDIPEEARIYVARWV